MISDRYNFKGKLIDSKEWIYGFYSRLDNDHIITDIISVLVDPDTNSYENEFRQRYVIPGTVCQCVGEIDNTGKLVYEDDIDDDGTVIAFYNGSFGVEIEYDHTFIPFSECSVYFWQHLEIVSNLHDQEEK